MATILITGCSSGIGQATALHLARQGHMVYACVLSLARGADELEAAATEENLDLRVLELDVRDSAACERVMRQIQDEQDGLDVLINNAGITRVESLEETPEAIIRENMEVNYFGAVRLMQLALPGMREARSGTIINVTSLAGRISMPFNTAYVGSKFALESLTESMAMEVAAFNIRVALIEPGVTLTGLQEKVEMPSPTSPYAALLPRSLSLYGDAVMNPNPAINVARVIEQAMQPGETRLRYRVGADAERMIEARSKMSDEEWLAFGNDMSDDDFAKMRLEYFGV